jgi:hypothetical protein
VGEHGPSSFVEPQRHLRRPVGAELGGNDVDGILSTEYVADCILAGIQQEKFLVLPHPQVSTYFRRKAGDHDRWIEGMKRFRRKLAGES